MSTIIQTFDELIEGKKRDDVKNPIELCKHVSAITGEMGPATYSPSDFKRLILWDQDGQYDVILAIHRNGVKVTYLGHWNDGVI